MSTEQQNITETYTLADLMKDVWRGRVFIALGVIVGAVAAFAFMIVAVPHARGQITLAPATPMSIVSAAAPSGNYGDNIAPSQIGGTEALAFTRFEASYKGAEVARLLLRDPTITDGLAADKRFTFSVAEEGWNPEKLSAYIERRVRVDPVGQTALRELSYMHPDAEFAVRFLHRMHNVTDGLIRHAMRKDVNERIAYLNTAIAETINPEHRRAMTDLLIEQERLKMLVSIDQPYAASVVVPAAVSLKTRWPDGALMYPVCVFVGAMLGFGVFGFTRRDAQKMAVLPATDVEQKDWFFPESGNNNEKPLTGQKAGKKAAKTSKKTSKKTKRIDPPASEAAE